MFFSQIYYFPKLRYIQHLRVTTLAEYSTTPKGSAFTMNSGAFPARHVRDVTIESCHHADHIVIRLDDLWEHLAQKHIQGSLLISVGAKHNLNSVLT